MTQAINKIKEVYFKMLKAYTKGKMKKAQKLERKLTIMQLRTD